MKQKTKTEPQPQETPTAAAIAELTAVLEERQRERLSPVETAKADLAPDVARAKRLVEELRAYEKDHGEEIRALMAFDWFRLAGRVHHADLEKMSAAAAALGYLGGAIRVLSGIPARVEALSAASVKEGEPAEIRADVTVHPNPRAVIEERLQAARVILAGVLDQARQAKGPVPVASILKPLPKESDGVGPVITAFDPLAT